jgi:NAD(P)-dependent dehydrogenase (short-subunit alcohol dehydrogenase family)
MRRLEGKVVAAVGAATGIGAATLRYMISAGAKVFLGDINTNSAESLAHSLRADGGVIEVQYADQGDDESIGSFIKAVHAHYGRLDGLFLNGAETSQRMQETDSDIVDIDMAVWDRIMRVNLTGYMLGIRHAVPAMLKTGGGSIVLTGSELAFKSDGHLFAYGVSKAAVNALARHTAARFGRQGVRCNVVAPGVVVTEAAKSALTPDVEKLLLSRICGTRMGLPEDVAPTVVHLLSDESAYINGQAISINGGSLFR